MRCMGTQFRMRRVQFDSCASLVNNCLRRRPEWVPMRRMGTRSKRRFFIPDKRDKCLAASFLEKKIRKGAARHLYSPPHCRSEQNEESWLVRIFPASLEISPDGRNDNGVEGIAFSDLQKNFLFFQRNFSVSHLSRLSGLYQNLRCDNFPETLAYHTSLDFRSSTKYLCNCLRNNTHGSRSPFFYQEKIPWYFRDRR